MTPSEMIHVYAIAPDTFVSTPDDIKSTLGLDRLDESRTETVDASALVGVGLSGYLTDGHGASADAVLPDEARLDAQRGPVLILLPGAVSPGDAPVARPPLSHLGSYPLEAAKPADGRLRSASAERTDTAPPPSADPERTDRRNSGRVAMIALAVALLIALIVWLLA
ncbi:hypothetical protein OCGS_2058 [Oceaniovalibus guishaninsula JLT2003]|uniref:Aspartate carbamoyltransferase catalytic subunit n=1 Tax=Oceaniovalibus guishaninsula JLT2003 TaxID=1231392 RepID=K2HLG5_9RHOB|nr:hypothetical protein [Oceaniovalibus guishaninsula]EKE43724.1 hypothetical protein OCGS_2058 [Oceaniovalibus guishaninsula JLT2003]